MPQRHLSNEWRIQGGVEDALQGLHWDRIGREVSDLPAAADETVDHLALRGAIRPLEQLCQRFEHHPPPSALAERTGRAGHEKNLHLLAQVEFREAAMPDLLIREGAPMQALEAGLLTDGSSYSPTPSQRSLCQWRILLAFVPAHSGASVRDFHPLPVSSTSRTI